jgi:hypothetical protein
MAGLGLFDQKSALAVTMPIVVTAFKFCIEHKNNGLLNRYHTGGRNRQELSFGVFDKVFAQRTASPKPHWGAKKRFLRVAASAG